MHSGLSNEISLNPHGEERRPYLSAGRVTSPVPPSHEDFEKYERRCQETYTVDVMLDSGEYVSSCRVSAPQSGGTEGERKLPGLPDIDHPYGDSVVVAFLYGSTRGPVILNSLTPTGEFTGSPVDPEDMARFGLASPRERQRRSDFVDRNDPARPTVSHVERTDGPSHETEHVGEVREGDYILRSAQLERNVAGRDIEAEQVVQVDENTRAVVRDSNQAGTNLSHIHAVQTRAGTSSVTVEDLQAQVLQLTHQVEALGRMVMRSDQVNQSLTLQHETPQLRTTATSDGPTRSVSLIAEDLTANSRAGLTIGHTGSLVLRRSGADNKESFIVLNRNGSITIRTPHGPSIQLDQDQVTITSGQASFLVSEDGISSVTKLGGVLNIDSSVIMGGDNVIMDTDMVHMKAGSILAGDTALGTAKYVPDATKVVNAVNTLARQLRDLTLRFNTHTHPVAGTAASPTLQQASLGAQVQMNVQIDSLKTVRGV
jgi:hypothetical protein